MPVERFFRWPVGRWSLVRRNRDLLQQQGATVAHGAGKLGPASQAACFDHPAARYRHRIPIRCDVSHSLANCLERTDAMIGLGPVPLLAQTQLSRASLFSLN